MRSYRTFVERSAERLLQAELSGLTESPLSAAGQLDTATAYKIQDEQFCYRLERGEHGVGIAVQPSIAPETSASQDPVTGWLTDAMVAPSGGRLPIDASQRTELSPQFAFVLGQTLEDRWLTAEAAGAAIDRIYPALLVTRSRYAGHGAGPCDVIADNLSLSRYLVGGIGIAPTAVELRLEASLLEVNGTLVGHSTGASLGTPLRVLAAAINSLIRRGHVLERGWTILVGPVVPAIRPMPGDTVIASFTHLGSVAVTCHDEAIDLQPQ